MHGQRPPQQGRRPPWLPEPYHALWRSNSAQPELDTAAGSRSPPAASEQQRKQLRSLLLDSFQQDPKGTSELLARTLDGRTQRVLLATFAEQPALSRHRLVPPEVVPETPAAGGDAPPLPPTPSQVLAVAVTKGLPFVAFGFFDNLIMITAGEQIDLLLGAKLNLSSMAAAGLGNTVADVVGINISTSIENYFKGANTGSPTLTKAQWNMPQTRRAKWLGCALGMATGCLLGLTPLLLMTDHKCHDGRGHERPARAGDVPAAAVVAVTGVGGEQGSAVGRGSKQQHQRPEV